DVAQFLLANNADVDAKDNKGQTPARWAAHNGYKKLAELLRQHGDENGSKELDDSARSGDLAKVQALLKGNPRLVFSKDDLGMAPLHIAASAGHKDVAEALLASHADVNAKDNNGWSPLHFAASAGHQDVVELLLAHKADANAQDSKGDTPSLNAATAGHQDIAELLLAGRPLVKASDEK